MKLFQKLPLDTFETKLPKLITVVCNAMKNRLESERDGARETLSKMAVSLDLKYLPLVISEMAVCLSEGYKLHVRSAALHSILVALSKVYQQPAVESVDAIASLPFDRCVPAMLDLIHQGKFPSSKCYYQLCPDKITKYYVDCLTSQTYLEKLVRSKKPSMWKNV